MSAAGRAREPEAEMPATEKDLADDAPWKRIQQNTFTRWCNEHLKCVQKRVGNLQTDLGDGLRLIALLEVLSQKKLGRRYNGFYGGHLWVPVGFLWGLWGHLWGQGSL
uniref:Calponin-homology (CH) domain-containing protein n=1 Tax=Coturnix japonica TaxID=93934 RepID=A0A8C2Y5Q3_COTJA